jgi:hypothetical protein
MGYGIKKGDRTVGTITLNVISLDTAIKYLDADAVKVEELLNKGLIEHKKIGKEIVVDEEQFNYLSELVERNGLQLRKRPNISRAELQDFCITRGYVSSKQEFIKFEVKGLFHNYQVTHPFNGIVQYKSVVIGDIMRAVERGGIVTLRNGGYTKGYIMENLGINYQRFRDLTVRLGIIPQTFYSIPIYSKDQLLSIQLLNQMVSSVSKSKSKTVNDAIFVYKGNEYISKENVRAYLGTKYSTIVYLSNLGVLNYRDIVYKDNVLTVVPKKDLDLIKSCLNKGYKPAVISLVLSGFLTVEELSQYVLKNDFAKIIMNVTGLDESRSRVLIYRGYPPSLSIHGVDLYSKQKVVDFIRRFVRGTHSLCSLSSDFITATKLAQLVGRSAKNVKSYAMKYLKDEDVVRVRSNVCIRLNAYMRLQKDTRIIDLLESEEQQIKNRLNFHTE